MRTFKEMEKAFYKSVRAELLAGLEKCTDAQRVLFKRMYAGKNQKRSIVDVVGRMAKDKLDWAMQQVQRTIDMMNADR